MKEIPHLKLSLSLYIGTVLSIGAVLLGINIQSLTEPHLIHNLHFLDLLIWLAIILTISRFHIVSKSGQATSTLNSTLDYCLIFAFGQEAAVIAVVLSSLYLNIIRRRSVWYKVLFNTAQLVIAVNAAGWLYQWAGGVPGIVFDLSHISTWLRLSLPFFAFSLTNLLLVSLAVRLSGGPTLHQQVKSSHYYEIWGNFILFYLGALLSNLYISLGWPGVLAGVLPLAWVYVFILHFNELQETHGALDATHKELKKRGEELQENNQQLEEANTALRESNENLSKTRKSLVRSEKMKAMGQLASGVAHDFNNILGAILARAELLQLDESSDPKLNRGLALIHKSALDGAEVVRRIQDFSRVREQHSMEKVQIEDLVEDTLEMTRAIWKDKAQKSGRTYSILRDLEPGLSIRASAAELREVLTNLVLNAIEAMPSGGSLNISSKKIQDKAVLQVRDSGMGMTPEVRERLFDPFFTTKGARGNGLGLSVTAGIIEGHKGTIQIESEEGKGSCFTLVLPLADESEISPSKATQSVKPFTMEPKRVLVVDDEEDVREVLVEILRLMGHEVDEASSGAQGLELFFANPYDVVFTDLGMPEMNGWELADLIRVNHNSEVCRLILVSGWGAQIKAEDVEAHKVDRVLTKPFRIEELSVLMSDEAK